MVRRSTALTDPSRNGPDAAGEQAGPVDHAGEENLPFRLRLRFRREQAGLKQWELAEALGVHNTLLSAYENGRRRPAQAGAFELRHREAIEEAQRRRVTTALSESAGREVVLRSLSRAAADACLDLTDELSRTLHLPVEADVRPERGTGTFRLRVRLRTASTKPAVPQTDGEGRQPPDDAQAAGSHRVA